MEEVTAIFCSNCEKPTITIDEDNYYCSICKEKFQNIAECEYCNNKFATDDPTCLDGSYITGCSECSGKGTS